MADEDPYAGLRKQLEEAETWPCKYLFKFIAPRDIAELVVAVFEKHPVQFRESSGGKYISISAEIDVSSVDEIIEIYEKVSLIDGVISL